MTQGTLSSHDPLPLQRRTSLVPLCGACQLYKGCHSPKMPLHGQGKKKILIIGEAPGETEDKKGIPFVGKAGHRLRRDCAGLGIDLDRDCWITNTLICRPPVPKEGGNSIPTEKQIDFCRPNILRIVQEKNPLVIIPLGSSAVRSVLGWLWRENPGGVERWHGWKVPCQKWNCWICPSYHPSFVEREESPLLDLIFEEELKAAFSYSQRPWIESPNYPSRCRFVYDSQEAAGVIKSMMGSGLPIAFDYETNALKPDNDLAKIVCCSVSDGEQSVAFWWKGYAVEAMKEFLRSDTPKIASNQKFETVWSLTRLGIEPKNWLWDTMLAAHVLDNRPHISSIKFLGFAMLGEPAWDEKVAPYLKSKNDDERRCGANAINQIDRCESIALLRYNAMDSLMEWLVAHKQMRLLSI